MGKIEVYCESGLGPAGEDDGYVYGDFFRCEGSVRGRCGYRHGNADAAISCLHRDSVGSAMQGGYSDRCAHLYDAAGNVVASGNSAGDFYAY